jgi:hypothetical protein
MTVHRHCSKKDLAVMVDVSTGESLRYVLSFRGARALFTLVNKQGTVLLSQTSDPGPPGPWALDWPGATPPNTVPGEFTHTLGMHFLAAAGYSYTVTKLDAAGQASIVKSCTYESDAADDAFFEPLTVFVS